MHLIEHIAQQWSAMMADRCVLAVGLSGGLDSVVLLHILAQLRTRLPLQLSAIHVHHGLSLHADAWLKFCQTLCRQWDIPLVTHKVQLQAKSLGIEAAARAARYQIYANSQAQAVVLAHHADDQIETFFLAALRGGGLRALTAMPQQRSLNPDTVLWRPLLAISRQTIQQYAVAFDLTHIEDDSNTDTYFLRNWLRLEGLPAWRTRVSQLNNHIQATVERLQDELSLLDEIIDADWRAIHADASAFQVSRWRQLSAVRQRQQLHQFAQRHQLGTPRTVSIQAFATQLSHQVPCQWSLPLGKAVYYDDILWPCRADISQQWPWLTNLPAVGSAMIAVEGFQWRRHPLGLAAVDQKYMLRCVQSHDRIRLQGGHKSVKKLLQARKIAPFMRTIWPVVCDQNDVCVAVVNVAVASDLAIRHGFLPYMATLPNKT